MTPPSGRARAEAALARLFQLHPKKIDLSLERLERLLAKLDNPERDLPPVFHVAGTNGKGSVVAVSRAILEAAGHRVHVYTSPHLVRFNERIRIAGRLIEDEALADLLDETERVNDGSPITFFEVTTAAALLAFARTPADACILEVGLGGRLDATNVIERPLATAITPIHFDHRDFLGNTLATIASEKAGIIKPGVPVVVARQPKAALSVIEAEAAKAGARLLLEGRDWRAEALPGGAGFRFHDAGLEADLPLTRLPGAHQVANAGRAIALLRSQSTLAVPEPAVRAGLDWARWPARLQRIEEGPLLDLLPPSAELWLDGGHNVMAGRMLRRHFRELDAGGTTFHVVVGMMSSKDAEGFLKCFAGLAEGAMAVPVPGEDGAMPAAQVAAAAERAGLAGRVAKDVPAALKTIAAEHKGDRKRVVLITGSLYLAGAVLRLSGLNADG